MNCLKCGKQLIPSTLTELWSLTDSSRYFCELDCLRAWLGPDRPLTTRIKAHEREQPTPQPVVVGPVELFRREGESDQAYHHRLAALQQFRLA
jgi:hypothetical protein